MKIIYLKRMITVSTCLVQVFCAFWILARGSLALFLMVNNWHSTPNALTEFLRMAYEMAWMGLLPVLLFNLIRHFLHLLADHQFFTAETESISRRLIILVACWSVLSMMWDLFVDQKSVQNWIDIVENMILPYIDDLALIIILGVLHLVIKNGKMIQEDVDGFV